MSSQSRDWVVACLRDPAVVLGMAPRDWDLFIRQAAAGDLIARVAELLALHDLIDRVPPAPRMHLRAAMTYARSQQDGVAREVGFIHEALAASGLRAVLLKGAAYVMAGLDASRGRMFQDVDVLVSRGCIGEAEAALMLRGWATTHHDAYDQKYYRQWMHEIPPMQHIHRGTTIDAHHAILPLTGRIHPEPALLIAEARSLQSHPGLAVLSPVDMVLHSVTHLFMNEEFSHGLRDLSDIDLMLRQFGVEKSFWPALVARSRVLGLGRLLHYALRHASRVFATPVPASATDAVGKLGPGPLLGVLMDFLWTRALRSPHPSVDTGLAVPATFLLYLRAHWMRMPLPMLVMHLTVKAFKRAKKPEQEA